MTFWPFFVCLFVCLFVWYGHKYYYLLAVLNFALLSQRDFSSVFFFQKEGDIIYNIYYNIYYIDKYRTVPTFPYVSLLIDIA
jgi:hypothetical protein